VPKGGIAAVTNLNTSMIYINPLMYYTSNKQNKYGFLEEVIHAVTKKTDGAVLKEFGYPWNDNGKLYTISSLLEKLGCGY
jgi:hypothetical protein